MSSAQPDFFQRRTLERKVHIAIADLLRLQAHRKGFWFSHVPAGEHRSQRTGALLKRMGTKRGMADFLLIGPDGRHFGWN
jgi:hypothetical protein